MVSEVFSRIGTHAQAIELRQEQPEVRPFICRNSCCDRARPLLPITKWFYTAACSKVRPGVQLTIYLANQGLVSSLGENSGPQLRLDKALLYRSHSSTLKTAKVS